MKESILLALLLMGLPVAVHAQFKYATNATGITVTRYTGSDDAVIIPSNVNGLPVTIIGNGAFSNTFLTSVTVPDSVTSIKPNAFSEDFELSSVILGTNVSNIEDS